MSSSEAGNGTPPPNKSDIPRGLINRTGNPTGRGARLPSVRGQRDLTLGGVQRKVFTPNLAAVKKTPKEENSKSAENVSGPTVKDHDDGRKGRGRGRGRGRGGGRGREDRTIQIQSEFAHGPMGSSQGSGSRSVGGGGGGFGGGGSGGRSTGSSESASKTSTMRATKRLTNSDEDKKMLDTLLRDDFVSDLSAGDSHMTPIKLPLHLNTSNKAVNIKKEETVKVKEEIDAMETEDHGSESVTDKRNTEDASHTAGSSSSAAPASAGDVLSSITKTEKGELLLIQLPDTLPGVPVLDADDKPQSSTSSTAELTKRMNLCQLKDCSEGYMGKLRIHQSGKTELVLNGNVMDVLSGIPINFHQELVSVHTDSNTGQMIVLGPVNNKLVVTPNYNSLLQNVHNF